MRSVTLAGGAGGPHVMESGPEELEGLLRAEAHDLVLLYFWGPDCPNCEVFSARLPGLLDALAGSSLLLVKVDAYRHPEVARRYAVFGIPHFLLFKNGRRVGKMSEFRGDAFWLSVVREQLAS